MSTFLRKRLVVSVLVLGLVCLLTLQLTGLSCLQEWWTLGSSGESILFSSPVNESNQASQQVQDACPCHFSIAQGEHLHLPVAWSPTRTIPSTPVTHLSLLVTFLFHPPVVA